MNFQYLIPVQLTSKCFMNCTNSPNSCLLKGLQHKAVIFRPCALHTLTSETQCSPWRKADSFFFFFFPLAWDEMSAWEQGGVSVQ